MNDQLFVGMQHLLPQHALTRVVYALARNRTRFIKNAMIASFVRHFKPDMSEAVQPDPLAYPTFNEFFTRALRADARPVDSDPAMLVSPVDGIISQIGPLDGSQLPQAKGLYYTLDGLLQGPHEYASMFAGGAFATLYLAPFNYHRIHMPLTGTLRAAWYLPGNLFSVNAVTAATVAGLFARNERVVCVFEARAFTFAMILVGALFVGSMETVWHGQITPRWPRKSCDLPGNETALLRGLEMGRFNMGSTVILLLPPAAAQWLPGFEPGASVRVGQAMARLL